ncbi:MAG: phosphomannomutase/phosphoglucomutase [bacterium]|nr:phosphomannomutase/phosphoglucomutase [bacterium]
MEIPQHIFKSYDIRGLVDGELSEELARNVGMAVVVFTGAKTVAIGNDMRETSPAYKAALIDGVASMGANVVDVGLCSTPMFNFAVTQYPGHDVGIMVTASHNPKEYNGFKMTSHNGLPIGKGTGMDEIRDLVTQGEFEETAKKGSVTTLEIRKSYLDRVFEFAEMPSIKSLSVVVDASNGMNGILVDDFFSRLDCIWQGLYLDPDGTFPNHEANPLKEEAQVDTREKMKEVGADLGIIYDGDGDRVGFLDEKGVYVRGDLIAALLAEVILVKHPGGTIFLDLRSTQATFDAIKQKGGVPKISEVGHANVKRHMMEEQGVFGAELSSHFFFKEFANAEVTELVVLLVLKKMVEEGKTLSELIKPYRTYATAEETNFKVDDREATIDRIEERYAPLAERRIDIDGVTFYFDGWWFNLRPSNTEPIVRLTLEAEDAVVMNEKMKEITELIGGVLV